MLTDIQMSMMNGIEHIEATISMSSLNSNFALLPKLMEEAEATIEWSKLHPHNKVFFYEDMVGPWQMSMMEWVADKVTAAKVTTMHEFRGLFSSEVLAPGQQVGVESISILFSDILGSTAFYENVGNAQAYGKVRRHFEFMMDWIHTVHHGPAIAVNSNDRLDYFGRTVNIASRIQGLSRGGDIIISEASIQHPEV
ncbi:Adenylate and Guanylate cyclase catalytic domain protein [compost metagenome]